MFRTYNWRHSLFYSYESGSIRVVTQFRKFNLFLKRHRFPIPKIECRDMIQPFEWLTFLSALDLNLGYYWIKLDADAQDQYAIVLLWGKYIQTRLPTGVKIAWFLMFFKKSCLSSSKMRNILGLTYKFDDLLY
jgi:hypothetical protein